MASEISSAEEKAASFGKGLNYFKVPTLGTSRRKGFVNRRIDSFATDVDMKEEQEQERAFKRGRTKFIQDPKAHFQLKNKIKSRMFELASVLSMQEDVKQTLEGMFYMEKVLPKALQEV